MELICPRRAFLHDFSKKCPRDWWRNWGDRGVNENPRGQECQRQPRTSRNRTMLTRTKIRAARVGLPAIRRGRRLIRDAATTPSTTLLSSSPREERNSTFRRWSRSLRARRDSGPGRRCAIPNTAKAPSIIEKEKVKRPRLRYNSLASV